MDVRSTIDWMPAISLAAACGLAVASMIGLALLRRMFGPPNAAARRRVLFGLRAAVLLLLVAILLNPVRVDESPGLIERPKVVYLLDASRSMALGGESSRWNEALQIIGQAGQSLAADVRPEISGYRFGEGLSALESLDSLQPTGRSPAAGEGHRSCGPTDADTQLAGALKELSGRFGRTPPLAVVLFSDGQARDRAALAEATRRYAAIQTPIHAVPLGTADRHGDVAVAGLVAPVRVRKYTECSAHVSVRSYGYEGRRSELVLSSVDESGRVEQELRRVPMTLTSGLQSFHLNFHSETKPMRLVATIAPQPEETATGNNRATAEVGLDRTKIRVLYLDGEPSRKAASAPGDAAGERPEEALCQALHEDADIECNRIVCPGGTERAGGIAFPETTAQLFAYDVLVLNNVARDTLPDQELGWIAEWVSQRGGGVCMLGGPRSFATGQWRDSPLEKMLPVRLDDSNRDWEEGAAALLPVPSQWSHPLWNLVSDPGPNRAILAAVPAFPGASRLGPPKPGATVLAARRAEGDTAGSPAIVTAAYGKGRTMAAAITMAAPWSAEWGQSDNRYFAKFWRNAVYWLSETSSYGRRRLVASTDKILYRPGDAVLVEAAAYDEAANPARDCRVVLTIEPRSAMSGSGGDYSPLRWPRELARRGSEQGPLVAWSEELQMPRPSDGRGFSLRLPITESALVVAAAPSLRLELSAYEGATLIDSSSIDVQILDDPPELQNPLANPQLLAQVASASGGRVLSDGAELAAMLRDLPARSGPPRVEKTPLWSTWPLWAALVALLSIEWFARRRWGLA